jgi:hypothetical protein
MLRVLETGLVLVALAAATHAATYYVATDGKPENDGSHGKPWPSVEFALKKVGGGHTIVLRPGFYRGPIDVPRADAGSVYSPTVIRSEEKWKAVVVGSPGNGVNVGDHCDWVTIEGLEVLGAWYRGVYLGGSHNTLRNCWVHHNARLGVGMGNMGGLIENNLIEFNGSHVQFDHGVYASGRNHVFRGNIIRHNSGFGLHLYDELSDSLVAYNLVYGHPHQANVLVVRGDGGPNRIVHNTIFGDGPALSIWNGNGEVVGNNILVGGGDPIYLFKCKQVAADYNLCWPKSQHDGPHGVVAEPQLFNTTLGLFWLTKGSPAIGKGSADYALPADFWGRPVPKEGPLDLGAFRFVPSLLEPQARAGWYRDWAYGYLPKRNNSTPMIDLWVLPKNGPVEPPLEKPASRGVRAP